MPHTSELFPPRAPHYFFLHDYNHLFHKLYIPFFLQYKDEEEVVVWMNTVGPYHNRQETYEYFSLPFCKGAKKTISHYHENLGEALQGVELEFSGLDVAFKSKIENFLLKLTTLLFYYL